MSGEESHRIFGACGWTNGVSSRAAQALSWLEEFFSPWMEIGGSRSADYEIAFDVEPGAFAALRRELDGEPSGSAESFVQDGRVALDPCWQDGRGAMTVLLAKGSVAYHISPAARRGRIVAERDGRKARLALLRAVRELAIIAARRRGGLLVHGAALARAGRVVVVSGPREAGKTTFLLHALAAAELGLTANDRVLVHPDADATRATVRGVPTIVSIRAGTLAMLPALAERMSRSRPSWALSSTELAGTAPALRDAGRNPSPRQLCDLLGVEPVAAGPLASIVFPTQATGTELRLARVPHDRAGELLRASLLGGAGTWPSASLWLGPDLSTEPTGPETEQRCRDLASRVPLYSCAIGPQALGDRRAMSELVTELAR